MGKRALIENSSYSPTFNFGANGNISSRRKNFESENVQIDDLNNDTYDADESSQFNAWNVKNKQKKCGYEENTFRPMLSKKS